MLHNPKVAIVIVNWNKKDYVLSLLNSLTTIDYDNYEIIVVDNASTDGSAEAIRHEFPNIHAIVNPQNIGGTGGFNTGMRYALQKGGYKYIWLLDNDVQVENNTLKELIKAMEKDETIGLAGSRIVDAERRDITVEAGAFIRWDTIDVNPLFRNKKSLDLENQIEDVDYVAVCSALIKVNALICVGLMDERFFLFWDDMDWGLYFKEGGFKVVAVPQSVVYHASFTERKRGVLNDFYYGTRNSLLVYTKHTSLIKRFLIFYNYFRYFCKGVIFLFINRNSNEAQIGIKAVRDFCNNNWGKCNIKPNQDLISDGIVDIDSKIKEAKKILIIAGDIKENIQRLNERVAAASPKAKIKLLVQDDRLDIFKPSFSDMVVIDSHKNNSLVYNIMIFLKILLSGFDLAVSPNISPFSFATRKTYLYKSDKDLFIKTDNDYLHIYKLILATILGEITSLIVTPFVYFKSIKYKKDA